MDNTDTVAVLQETIDNVDSTSVAHIASTTAHGVTGAVVGTTNAQTLTNKTISDTNNTLQISHFGLLNKGVFTHAEIDTHVSSVADVHGATGAVVGTTDAQTLTNKTISALSNTISNLSHTTLTNIGTNSHAQIDSHISSTAAHGATGAVVGTTNTQTLTNKTLTAPVISTISNAGTLTLPTGTRTLVARDTTDALTNKSISLTTTGGTPATLDYYETGTQSMTFTGPFVSGVAVTLRFVRIGSIVTLFIPAFDNTANSTNFIQGTGLLTRLTPATTNLHLCRVWDNSTLQVDPGQVSITNGGIIQIRRTLGATGDFTNSGTCGLPSSHWFTYALV